MSDVRVKFVPPGSGTIYHVLGGDQLTVKVSSADTGGAFTLLETIAPPSAGPPLHVHTRESETFFVLDGQFKFVVGDQTIQAAAGEVLVAPPGIPHRFQNVGESSGRLLICCQPGGFEHFMEGLDQLSRDAEPDMQAVATLAAQFGIRFTAVGTGCVVVGGSWNLLDPYTVGLSGQTQSNSSVE